MLLASTLHNAGAQTQVDYLPSWTCANGYTGPNAQTVHDCSVKTNIANIWAQQWPAPFRNQYRNWGTTLSGNRRGPLILLFSAKFTLGWTGNAAQFWYSAADSSATEVVLRSWLVNLDPDGPGATDHIVRLRAYRGGTETPVSFGAYGTSVNGWYGLDTCTGGDWKERVALQIDDSSAIDSFDLDFKFVNGNGEGLIWHYDDPGNYVMKPLDAGQKTWTEWKVAALLDQCPDGAYAYGCPSAGNIACITCDTGYFVTAPRLRANLAAARTWVSGCTLCISTAPEPAYQLAYTPTVVPGTDSYTWTCWPGFPGVSQTRQCMKKDGAWLGTPPVCSCGPIEIGHSCSFSGGQGTYSPWAEGTDTLNFWSFTFAWPGATSAVDLANNWFYDPLTPGGRGPILMALRTEVYRAGQRVTFNVDFAASAFASGLLVMTSLLANGNTARYRLQVLKANGSPMGIALNNDLWSGSLAAIQTKYPTADVYLSVSGPTDTFKLNHRFDVTGAYGGTGLITYWQNYGGGLDRSRDVASVTYRWLWRKCPAGTYQVGDSCIGCPFGTYNPYPNMAAKVDGTIPCSPCACDFGCQVCDAVSGACSTNMTHCYMASVTSTGPVCIVASSPRRTEEPCVSCQPQVSQGTYSPTPAAIKCDDGDQCTFFDTCWNGKCAGKPADCLTAAIQGDRPWLNCEACGNDKCVKRQSYRGCVYQYPNGTSRVCGCSIGGACYPHGGVNPSNTCQQCDVTRDTNNWVPTPAKLCNDGNACTYNDVCGAGVCSGQAYVCAIAGPCVAGSTCDGMGSCNALYKPNTTQCSPSDDPCRPASFCSGTRGFCPPVQELVPLIRTGGVLVGKSINTAGPQPVITSLQLRALNFTVGCGVLQFSFGLYRDPDFVPLCDPSAVTAGGSAVAFADGLGSWTPYAAASSVSRTLSVPITADVLRAVVRVRNLRGTVLEVCSDTFVADASAPAPGSVQLSGKGGGPLPAVQEFPGRTGLAGFGGDSRAVAVFGSTFRFTWGGFVETFAASTWGSQLNYSFAVGRAPLTSDAGAPASVPSDVLPWASLGLGPRSVQLDPVFAGLPLRQTLVLSVSATNKAGLTTFAASVPFAYDPSPAALTGGSSVVAGPDGTVTATGTYLTTGTDAAGAATVYPPLQCLLGSWAVASGVAALAGFDVAWGTAPGSQDVAAFAVVPGGAAASFVALPFSGWVEGTRYFCTVRAWTTAGVTATAWSKGAVLDNSPPLHDSTGIPDFWPSAQSLTLQLAVNGAVSPVLSTIVWIGTSPNGTDVAGAREATSDITSTQALEDVPGNGLTVAFNQNVADGTTLFVTVRVTSAVGLTSTVSATTVVDSSAPVMAGLWAIDPATAADPAAPAVLAHSGPGLAFRWRPVSDSVSGVDLCVIRVVTNGATVPDGGPVAALPPADGYVVSIPDTAVGSTAGYVAFPSAVTTPGWTYWAILTCTNGAGLAATDTSAGAVVDASPPSLEPVGIRGTGPASALHPFLFSPVADSLTAAWVAVDAQSGVVAVAWAVGVCDVSPTGVMNWTSLALPAGLTGATVTGLTLSRGVDYCVTVEATNAASLRTRASAGPIRIDTTPPTVQLSVGVPGVRDLPAIVALQLRGPQSNGLAPGAATSSFNATAAALAGLRVASNASLAVDVDGDADYSPDDLAVAADWAGLCSDEESGVTYGWCAGRAAGDCSILPLTDVGNATSAVQRVPSSLVGVGRVIVTVVCANGAGLSSTASSDGVVYDAQPPALGSAMLVRPKGADVPLLDAARTAQAGSGVTNDTVVAYANTDPTLRLLGFATVAAPLVRHVVWAGTRPGARDLLAPTAIGPLQTLQLGAVGLVPGRRVYVSANVTTATGRSLMYTGGVPVVFAPVPVACSSVSVPDDLAAIPAEGPFPAVVASSTTLPLCIAGVLETVSGIANASVLIGSASNADVFSLAPIPVPEWSGLGPSAFARGPLRLCANVSASPLQFSLFHNATVTLVNGAGVETRVSVRFLVDPAPPGPFAVYPAVNMTAIVQAAAAAAAASSNDTSAALASDAVDAAMGQALAASVASPFVLSANASSGSAGIWVPVTWSEPIDRLAALTYYTLAVGRSPGGSDVLDGLTLAPRQLPRSVSAVSGVSLVYAEVRLPRSVGEGRFYVSVAATTLPKPVNVSTLVIAAASAANATGGRRLFVREAGRSSLATAAQPLLVDASPPTFPSSKPASNDSVFLFAGLSPEATAAYEHYVQRANATAGALRAVVAAGASLVVRWLPASDPQSDVVAYHAALVTAAPGQNASALLAVPPNASSPLWRPADMVSRVLEVPFTNFTSGSHAAVWLRATNGVGLTSHAASRLALVDGDAPVLGAAWFLNASTVALRAGAVASSLSDAASIVALTDLGELAVAFDAPTDQPSEASCSAVVVTVSVGSTPGAADVVAESQLPLQPVPPAKRAVVAMVRASNDARARIASSPAGVPLYATVAATDCAGHRVTVSSVTVLAIAAPVPRAAMAVALRALPAPVVSGDVPAFASLRNLSAVWSSPTVNAAASAAADAVGTKRVAVVAVSLGLSVNASEDGLVCGGWQAVPLPSNASNSTAATAQLGDTRAFTCANLTVSTGLRLGVRYYGLLAVIDALGQKTVVASALPATYDTSPPLAAPVVAPAVTGGLRPVRLSWLPFRDDQSVVRYRVGVTTNLSSVLSRGLSACCDAVPLTNADTSLEVTLPPLNLTSPTTVYAVVFGCNGAGLCTVNASGAVVVDPSLPGVSAVTVTTSGGAAVRQSVTLRNGTVLNAAWQGVAAPQLESWRLCLTEVASSVYESSCAYVPASARTGSLRVSDAVRQAAVLRVSVTAMGAGNVMLVEALSAAFVNDATPPGAFTVLDGPLPLNSGASAAGLALLAGATPQVSYMAANTRIVGCHWTAAAEPESGPVTYTVAIGTRLGVKDLVPWRSVGTARNLTLTLLDPPFGGTWICTVNASNALGMTTAAVSTGFTVDVTPPYADFAVVRDGWDSRSRLAWLNSAGSASATSSAFSIGNGGSGIATSASNASAYVPALVYVWSSFSGFSEPESSIAYYEAALVMDTVSSSRRTVSTVIVPWARIAGVAVHVFANVSVPDNATVRTLIRAVNILGLVSGNVSSPGARVDVRPPKINSAVIADSAAVDAQAALGGGPGAGSAAYDFLIDPAAGVLDITPANVTAAPRMVIGFGTGSVQPDPATSSCPLTSWPLETTLAMAAGDRSAAAAAGVDGLLAINGTSGTLLTSVCLPGYYRLDGLGACVPCALGTYKPTAGDGPCRRCAVGSLSAAQAASAPAMVAFNPQMLVQRGLGLDGAGATTCGCHDDSAEVYLPGANASLPDTVQPGAGCVCRPGYAVNPLWTAAAANSSLAAVWPAEPSPCIPVARLPGTAYQRSFKPVAGSGPWDQVLLTCPAASSNPDASRSTCVCTDTTLVFDPVAVACVCPAGQWRANKDASCTACPPGLFKPKASDDRDACVPCPWGLRPAVPGHAVCEAIPGVVSGAVVVAKPALSLACAPGTVPVVTSSPAAGAVQGLSAVPLDVGINTGVVLPDLCLDVRDVAFSASADELAKDTVALPAGASDPAWFIAGVALTEEAIVGPGVGPVVLLDMIHAMLAARNFSAANVSIAIYTLHPTRSCRLTDLPVDASRPVIAASCVPCDAGLAQPLTYPFTNASAALAAYGGPRQKSCGACPVLQRGSPFVSSLPRLMLNWTGLFTDDASGIAGYSFAIGLLPGGSQVVPFTETGTNTTVVMTLNPPPPSGSPLFLTVVAKDGAGNQVAFMDARPVLYDTSPPTAGAAVDGSPDSTPALLAAAAAAAAAAANEDPVALADASMAALVTSFGGTPAVRPPTSSASANATNTSSPYSWRSDPAFTSVTLVADMNFQASSTVFNVSWEPFGDTGSCVVLVGTCLGTVPFSCDILPWSASPSAPTTPTVAAASLAVPVGAVAAGTTVFASVFAMNGLGMVSASATNGVLVDDKPPAGGRIIDVGPLIAAPESRLWWVARTAAAGENGTGSAVSTVQIAALSPPGGMPLASVLLEPATDLDCQMEGTGLGAAWSGFTSVSGVETYEWAVGSDPAGRLDDVVPWTNMGLQLWGYAGPRDPAAGNTSGAALNGTAVGPSAAPDLRPGAIVYASVRAVSRAGLSSITTSDGVRVIAAPVMAVLGTASLAMLGNNGTTANSTSSGLPIPAAGVRASDYADASGFVCVSISAMDDSSLALSLA